MNETEANREDLQLWEDEFTPIEVQDLRKFAREAMAFFTKALLFGMAVLIVALVVTR